MSFTVSNAQVSGRRGVSNQRSNGSDLTRWTGARGLSPGIEAELMRRRRKNHASPGMSGRRGGGDDGLTVKNIKKLARKPSADSTREDAAAVPNRKQSQAKKMETFLDGTLDDFQPPVVDLFPSPMNSPNGKARNKREDQFPPAPPFNINNFTDATKRELSNPSKRPSTSPKERRNSAGNGGERANSSDNTNSGRGKTSPSHLVPSPANATKRKSPASTKPKSANTKSPTSGHKKLDRDPPTITATNLTPPASTKKPPEPPVNKVVGKIPQKLPPPVRKTSAEKKPSTAAETKPTSHADTAVKQVPNTTTSAQPALKPSGPAPAARKGSPPPLTTFVPKARRTTASGNLSTTKSTSSPEDRTLPTDQSLNNASTATLPPNKTGRNPASPDSPVVVSSPTMAKRVRKRGVPDQNHRKRSVQVNEVNPPQGGSILENDTSHLVSTEPSMLRSNTTSDFRRTNSGVPTMSVDAPVLCSRTLTPEKYKLQRQESSGIKSDTVVSSTTNMYGGRRPPPAQPFTEPSKPAVAPKPSPPTKLPGTPKSKPLATTGSTPSSNGSSPSTNNNSKVPPAAVTAKKVPEFSKKSPSPPATEEEKEKKIEEAKRKIEEQIQKKREELLRKSAENNNKLLSPDNKVLSPDNKPIPPQRQLSKKDAETMRQPTKPTTPSTNAKAPASTPSDSRLPNRRQSNMTDVAIGQGSCLPPISNNSTNSSTDPVQNRYKTDPDLRPTGPAGQVRSIEEALQETRTKQQPFLNLSPKSKKSSRDAEVKEEPKSERVQSLAHRNFPPLKCEVVSPDYENMTRTSSTTLDNTPGTLKTAGSTHTPSTVKTSVNSNLPARNNTTPAAKSPTSLSKPTDPPTTVMSKPPATANTPTLRRLSNDPGRNEVLRPVVMKSPPKRRLSTEAPQEEKAEQEKVGSGGRKGSSPKAIIETAPGGYNFKEALKFFQSGGG
ncbi:hypothetical protein AGDE_12503 [Angomonas deanei]|nr:hypothetical protein AGDE_12503 [Angomonas deanei]|eukprot:EPY24098.1 hypothetical protein AGDE_12503 [Angomonas deanei]